MSGHRATAEITNWFLPLNCAAFAPPGRPPDILLLHYDAQTWYAGSYGTYIYITHKMCFPRGPEQTWKVAKHKFACSEKQVTYACNSNYASLIDLTFLLCSSDKLLSCGICAISGSSDGIDCGPPSLLGLLSFSGRWPSTRWLLRKQHAGRYSNRYLL